MGSSFETRESPRARMDSGHGYLAQGLGGLVHQRHWITMSGLLVSKTGLRCHGNHNRNREDSHTRTLTETRRDVGKDGRPSVFLFYCCKTTTNPRDNFYCFLVPEHHFQLWAFAHAILCQAYFSSTNSNPFDFLKL